MEESLVDPGMRLKDRLVLVGQFFDPSAAVFELVWWP